MENQEEILDVLTVFEKKPSRDIPPLLEDFLTNVAKTGKTLFPWNRLKPLFINKLEQVMDELNKDMPYDHLPPFPNVENLKYEDMKKRIIDAIQKFNGAPFTVQRICELVTEPTKHYNRCDKFLRGIEKNVMVVSTVDPFGRKIVSEPSRGSLVNGMDLNGFNQQKADASDITDGQPFAALPVSDWTGGNLASVWPLAMGNGADNMKPSFSEETLEESDSPDINQNSTDAPVDSVTEETKCDSDIKYADNEADNSESADSTVVQKDETSESAIDNKESQLAADSVQGFDSGNEVKNNETESSLAQEESVPFNFETKDSGKNSEDDSNQKSTESSVNGEASDLERNTDTSVKSGEEAKETDDTDCDGPPEKKMRLSDDVNTSTTDKEMTDIQSTETEETKTDDSVKETEVVQTESTSSAELEDTEKQDEVKESVEHEQGVEKVDQEKSGEDTEQCTPSLSQQHESVATSEQNITGNNTDNCPETKENVSADAVNNASEKETDNNSSENMENTEQETNDTAKADVPNADQGVDEAMETEQEEGQLKVEPAEISEPPSHSAEDETEPMEQE